MELDVPAMPRIIQVLSWRVMVLVGDQFELLSQYRVAAVATDD
jgi:hypothetical protein